MATCHLCTTSLASYTRASLHHGPHTATSKSAIGLAPTPKIPSRPLRYQGNIVAYGVALTLVA
eukprot:516633-Lingulodinium_polyedra.AAC.1